MFVDYVGDAAVPDAECTVCENNTARRRSLICRPVLTVGNVFGHVIGSNRDQFSQNASARKHLRETFIGTPGKYAHSDTTVIHGRNAVSRHSLNFSARHPKTERVRLMEADVPSAIARFPTVATERNQEFRDWFVWPNDVLRESAGLRARRLQPEPDGSCTRLVKAESAGTFTAMHAAEPVGDGVGRCSDTPNAPA